ncbi:MAG: apolipoprotein N-acyltransferase [Myxococcales bacterium]|nr:apolipoprotein N-acyltransferase [Myxococcales bacterium]
MPTTTAPAPLWLRTVVTASSAWLLTLVVPPASWHWLHWVVYLPMFWVMHPDTPRSNRWLAVLYGTLSVALLFQWIVHTITVFASIVPWVGAVAILLLFGFAFGLPHVLLWPMVHPLRQRFGPFWVLAVPALQVVLEWLSMGLMLFPYNHGVSQYRTPFVWQLASVTGIWGLTYLVFLVNAALAEVMFRVQEGRPFPRTTVAGAALALGGVVVFGAWRYERVETQLRQAKTMSVAQLQSAKGMEIRLAEHPREGFNDWLRQTEGIPEGTDVAVWAEGACPFNLNETPGRPNRAKEILSEVAKRQSIELVVGGGSRERTPDPEMGEDRVSVFNSVFHFDADGEVTDRYDKIVPLPFGEYLPFGGWFPGVANALNIGNFEAGTFPVLFNGQDARMASPICYEAILPRVCRLFRDADLFVTVTNDAWFGNTRAPHQHAMLAAVRATELGIPMFRSAYTGVSFVVEPHGAIQYETEPFTEVHRVVQVRLGSVRTIYSRLGDWFVWVCGLGLLVGWGITRRTDAPEIAETNPST